MGCPCENKNIETQNIIATNNSIESCNYTIQQISNWKDKYDCVKDIYSRLNLTSLQYNKDLGVLYSVSIYNNNPCYFKKELDLIQPIINQIINLNLC